MGITQDTIQQLRDLLSGSNNIVITAHKSPDGDSVGSSLGLYHYLKLKGHEVVVCHPDPAPEFLHWMPGQDKILNLEEHNDELNQAFENADLIFCLDYNSSTRIGQMDKPLLASSAKRVMIDHHRDPDTTFCDLMFSDITSCSTAQLVYEVIDALGDADLINPTIGAPLYTGIVTDTGSFRFSSTLPKTHRIAAQLMERGIEHAKIHENVYDNNSIDRIQLVSYALLEKLVLMPELECAYISLTQDELERFKATKGDTEGLVNQILAIQGVKAAIFMKETDGLIKMSFRSKGTIPVNELAKHHFGGGGHLNAAGGKFVGNMQNALDKLVTILPTFVEENKAHF